MPSTAVSRPSPSRALSARDRLALLCVALASPLAIAVALPQAGPGTQVPVAVIYPPWTQARDALALTLAAGHRVLRQGRAANVVVIAPSDEGMANRPSGALLLVALTGLAGCLDAPADDWRA